MPLKLFKNTVLFLLIIALACNSKSKQTDSDLKLIPSDSSKTKTIVVAANKLGKYLALLQGKNVGIVANQTSLIFKSKIDSLYEEYPNGELELVDVRINKTLNTHIVDSLLEHNIKIQSVFAPEHGFRGTADAGESVKDGIDQKTNIPIISLYGNNKKPNAAQLKGIEVMVFDIQDVGARFYTYISTLHYIMEACAEQGIPLIVLDRPNPNGHYIDGPIMEESHKSFVGMHPVPIVHGMTIGEYAQMINGEKWLSNDITCDLRVIKMNNYTHNTDYSLPIKPSPNLPNAKSINLYPSLCLFEGTNVSVGRGTNMQFQIIGSPYVQPDNFKFQFIPKPNLGAKSPKHNGLSCHGLDLRSSEQLSQLNLNWLIQFYQASKDNGPKESFFNSYFTKLAGTSKLQEQIEAGWSEDQIRATWKKDLEAYKAIRVKYLLYD